MGSIDWRGVFPAVTTKFDRDNGLDFEAMDRHLEFQLESGVQGIIIMGSLGENSALSMEEKIEMTRFYASRINQRVPLVVCIAESGTREALHLQSEAAACGADGYMILPPMRYASDRRETLNWFRVLGENARLPIMLYNNPVAYGTDLSPGDFEFLSAVTAFEAIKESSADTRRIPDIRRLCGDRYALFCGVDDLVYESFALGAVGWVAGLVVAFPAEAVRLYTLMSEGRWAEARALYEWFLPLLHLDVGNKFVQQIKLVEELNGSGSARVRPPRLELEGQEAEHVRSVFHKAMASRPAL